ncbi:DUF805 domain-containing protein [Companilactobacillus nodensis]|uniref:DUF805 domain-containing protein n=1 Tax=Companilactobacillus nodensis DSM 19682 = JCM 14932 = NBRC 107160 TaxID=1423775 RepID=A0A0R1KC91_9LACO|nr:DUF805 domain-containing protein [Companilactobacillus nodensis]KRK79107.1 hypothetical protein FD03_GL001470 [Companilactobacillus nodensis DSM 19682 = JCM 14932 = NBRC 107160]
MENKNIWNESNKPNLINSTKLYFQDMFVGAKRMSRADFWWGLLGMTIVAVVLIGLFGWLVTVMSINDFYWSAVWSIAMVMTLGYYLISIWNAVIRRLHDRNLRGWWMLSIVLPGIGELIMIVLACLPQRDENNNWAKFVEDDQYV